MESPQEPAYFLYLCCDACRYPLTSIVYECTECINPIFLCNNCFSLGASFGSHSREHECLRGPVLCPEGLCVPEAVAEFFQPPMAVNELVLFLRQISLHGFNWPRVSEHMPYVGRMKPFAVSNCEKIYTALLHVLFRKPPVHFTSLPRPEHVLPAGPANFSSLRDEFEHDWLPEAEVFIAEALLPGKTPETAASGEGESPGASVSLVQLLHGYNAILDERNARKRVILDQNLTGGVQKKRKFAHMQDKLRIFARPAALLGPGTLEVLAQNLVEEEKLRDAVARSLEWRKAGARSEDEAKKASDARAGEAVYVSPWTSETAQPTGLPNDLPDDRDLCDKVGVGREHLHAVKRLFQLMKPATVQEAVELVNKKIIGAQWAAKSRKPLSEDERHELAKIFALGVAKAIPNLSLRP